MRKLYFLKLSSALVAAVTVISGFAHSADLKPMFIDGKPWLITTSNSKSGEITFNKDGGGKMSSGLIKMNIRWAVNGAVTCIELGWTARHCVKFLPVTGGFEGDEIDTNNKIKLVRK